MREIKFRAWGHLHEKDKYEMFYNVSVSSPHLNTQIPRDTRTLSLICDHAWMQYIGLKDKNGKEIYEGDVVLSRIHTAAPDDAAEFCYYQTDDSGRRKICTKPKPCVVEFHPTKACYRYRHVSGQQNESWITKPDEIEIIGNIYENPELLEESCT